MNAYSRNDISKKRHAIPAQTILQPVWGTLNPYCTQAQIIQDRGEIREVRQIWIQKADKPTGEK